MSTVDQTSDDTVKMVHGGAVIDKPLRGVIVSAKTKDGKDDETIDPQVNTKIDTLNTFEYAKALAEHVKHCGTPLTVGVQGEWGSGKTSLLNMMKEQIEQPHISVGRGRAGKRPGKYVYKTIWVNTWEHSLLKSPEQCLLSVLSELIDEISEVDGSYDAAQKAKSALSTLAKGALRIGAAAAMGAKGGSVADEIIGGSSGSENSVKVLRKTLEGTIKKIIERQGQDVQRFIIFIDDLDRLEPSTAVMILELLKNIFDLPYCIFVVAIDYQVVVKGLKEKFGEPTEENEWEFRAFFDKIIQLPFMMPMAKYSLDKYIADLLESVGYFQKRELANLSYFNTLLRLTVGYNPRALKRLVNSLSLIKKYRDLRQDDSTSNEDASRWKQLVLVFVCMQISLPRIFELLLRSAAFYDWDDQFVNRITEGLNTENQELAVHLNRAIEVNNDDFDTEWEQALFKIVWTKKWQRNKLVHASRVLSIIDEQILMRTIETFDEGAEQNLKLLEDALQATAVTSVASTEDASLIMGDADGDSKPNENAQGRQAFWIAFREIMRGKSAFNQWHAVKSTHTSAQYGRKCDDILDRKIEIKTSTKSSAAIRIESCVGSEKECCELFSWIRQSSDSLFGGVGSKPKYKISDSTKNQSITFPAPENIAPVRSDLSKKDLENKRDEYIRWIAETVPLIEQIMKDAVEKFQESPSPDVAADTSIDSVERGLHSATTPEHSNATTQPASLG